MKLISLNTWCGIKYEQLIVFLENYSKKVDVFCFQEVRNGEYLNCPEEGSERVNLFNDIQSVLSDFTGYFDEIVPGVGMASFVRNNIKVEKVKSIQVLTAKDMDHLKMANGNSYYPRLMQSIYLDNGLIVHNFHGIPGSQKKDSLERDLQTNRLIEVLKSNNSHQVLLGDFNLNINTKSIAKLEHEMRNLIKEGEFETTRNSNYNSFKELPFADYVFVSHSIKVHKFEVLPDEVSDHLALLLDFTY